MGEEFVRPDLFEVLDHYGWQPPNPGHGWQRIKCHAHGERKASAGVHYEHGYVNCFGCGFKGGSLDVIMHEEGVGFRDAISIGERFSREGNLDVRQFSPRLGGGAVSGSSRNTSASAGWVPPRLR